MRDRWRELRAWRHSGALIFTLAMALAITGCAPFGPLAGAVKTATSRATATPQPTLHWRTLSLPAPFNNMTMGIAVSPANGAEAWLCAPETGTQSYQVWRTTDAGGAWVKVGMPIALTASHAVLSCYLTPNQSDTNAVAINFNWGTANSPVNAPQGTQSYYSVDGGANWKAMPPDIWVERVVTSGAVTYAQIADTSQQSRTSLIVSDNHLATWDMVGTPGPDTPGDFQFWVAPTSGELLWSSMNGGGAYTTNYTATHNTWKPITPPASSHDLTVTLAAWQPAQAASFASNGWLICGYVPDVGVVNSDFNVCTHDGGATWTPLPKLTNTWECGHCGPTGGASSGVTPCLASAVSASGALYAVCGNDPQDSGTPWTSWTVSRIAPGASSWTTLGQTPTACVDMTTTSTGQAWCFNTLKGATIAYVLDALP